MGEANPILDAMLHAGEGSDAARLLVARRDGPRVPKIVDRLANAVRMGAVQAGGVSIDKRA